MKKYSIPCVNIIYINTGDIMQTSTLFDFGELMPKSWEDKLVSME